MKKYNILILICWFLFSQQSFAIFLATWHGDKSWQYEPSRFEKSTVLSMPCDTLNLWAWCWWGLDIQSNLLKKESFRENFKSLKSEYAKSSSCDDLCKAFKNATIQDIDNFLNNSSLNSQKKIDSLWVYFEVIMKSLLFFKIDANGSHPDEYKYGTPFSKKIILQRQNDGAIMGIMRIMANEIGGWPATLPGYFIFRIRIDGNSILFQQAALTSYGEIRWSSMNTFESNIIKAVKNGWKFQSADFKKRFAHIQNALYSHQVALMKQYPDKILKENEWKIENNVIKHYWGQLGENWLPTDIDPLTFNIKRCNDKYGAFFGGERITGDANWYCLADKLYKNDTTWQITTYSNNTAKLEVIKGVDIDTFQVVVNGYKSFSDKDALCTNFASNYSYAAYDKNYCYAATCNQCEVEKVGQRK
jgi:hypothetical protein